MASILKKEGVKVGLYNLTAQKIREHNIIFVGNIFSLSISYAQRFLPEHNLIFYAITEGIPMLDSMSHKLSENITYITPSQYTKQCLEQARLNVTAVIPHGINLNNEYDKNFHDRIKQGIPQPSKVEPSNIMLCVAGNWRRKALDKLLIGYKTVEKIMKDAFLILHTGIGDTNIVHLREMLELKRMWFTNLWGTLPSDKLASLYKLSDIYIQPSMVEGFGLTYLEAFRWNKPVIGVDCPATNELVKDGYTGVLIPVIKTEDILWQDRHAIRLHYFSVNDLIDAILLLCDEKVRARLATNIEKEKKRWNMEKTYKKFLEWLE
ncbi:glycosyltransferase family 4 protein [Patescibacteria group bacterium]|nr:glycosyltransferase family 4 protein [Patescibacteria group bacterium]